MIGRLLDTALDRSVVLGFTNVGLGVRRHLSGWPADLPAGALVGKAVAVTGATSGLGLATALGVARLGADVHLVVRDVDRAGAVRARIEREVPGATVHVHSADLADLDDVRRFAAEFLATGTTLDVLVHNAGVLPAERTESPQGHELTMAVHVLGPVLMTDLLRPALADGARIVFVTSGGMYAQRLREDDPEYLDGDYSGTTAYARSKRAQVELLPLLERRWPGTHVYAAHPGWADTPGVADSLPGFHKVTGPFLRDADGGADTTVWLAGVTPAPAGGGLWHDRRQRPTHFRKGTTSRPGAVDALWAWVEDQAGLDD